MFRKEIGETSLLEIGFVYNEENGILSKRIYFRDTTIATKKVDLIYIDYQFYLETKITLRDELGSVVESDVSSLKLSINDTSELKTIIRCFSRVI